MILVQIETPKISVFFKNLNVTNFRTSKQLWLIFMAAKAKASKWFDCHFCVMTGSLNCTVLLNDPWMLCGLISSAEHQKSSVISH